MPPIEPRLRHARVAVAAVFLTNGALFFNVVPRYPEIKENLGLGNASFGAAVAAFPLGALTAGLFAAAIIRRFRSAPVASFGIVLLAAAMVLIAVVPSWATLAVIMFTVGGADSVIDVAQNSHGLRVQRLYGRSINNSFHGVWSIGAVLGGLMGSTAAGLGLPLLAHFAIAGALFATVALVSYRFMLPGPDVEPGAAQEEVTTTDTVKRSIPAVAVRLLIALGVLAACGALVEDAGATWSALYLREGLETTAAVAGLGIVAMQAAMTIGRLLGDRVVNRFGQRTVARGGGALAALGMGAALAFPTVPTTLIGFALAGLGFATLVPAAMSVADDLPGLNHGDGLAVVSWLLRAGFLLSPPLVGVIADLSSLRVGLLSVVVAGVLAVTLSGALAVRRPGESDPHEHVHLTGTTAPAAFGVAPTTEPPSSTSDTEVP